MNLLSKDDILKKFVTDEKVIDVKAWGGKVKIRKLTMKEKAEINELMLSDATQEELEKGQVRIAISKMAEVKMRAVAYALVEPRLSYNELRQLDGAAMEGVDEIYEELEKFDQPNLQKVKKKDGSTS